MALLMFDGFEIYGTGGDSANLLLGRWSSLSNVTPQFGAAGARTGSRYLDVSFNGYLRWTFAVNYSGLYTGFGYKRAAADAANRIIFRYMDTATEHLYIQNDSDEKLSVYRGDGTLLGTSSIALTSTQWAFIEIYAIISDTVGAVTLRVDGSTVLTLTNVDTRNGGNATVNRISIGYGAGPGALFDDVYVDDAEFKGPVGIYPIVPDGAGQQSGFTRGGADSGENWSQVDENPPNSDTDYNYTSSVGAVDLYTTSEAAGAGTVLGVQIHNFARKTDASARSARPIVRTNSTNSEGAESALTTSYAYYTQLWEDNPVTATAWTASEINAIQIGTKCSA